MMRATEQAHLVVRHVLNPGDWAVDATAGNGHDTVFLAHCAGPTGRVFGFDVQEAAIRATSRRAEGMPHVTLFHCGHETLCQRLPSEGRGRIAAVMFNFGYLPGGAKDLVTKPETTLDALGQAVTLLRIGGMITTVLYGGHPGGADEAAAVKSWAWHLPSTFAVSQEPTASTLTQAPELFVIQRVR